VVEFETADPGLRGEMTITFVLADADGGPSFGAVSCDGFEIFLRLDGQGGRGRGRDGSDSGHGVWLSMWVDDVEGVHATCLREGLEVIRAPQDEPWGVREMQVRHPDEHVFRMSQELHRHDHDHEHDH